MPDHLAVLTEMWEDVSRREEMCRVYRAILDEVNPFKFDIECLTRGLGGPFPITIRSKERPIEELTINDQLNGSWMLNDINAHWWVTAEEGDVMRLVREWLTRSLAGQGLTQCFADDAKAQLRQQERDNVILREVIALLESEAHSFSEAVKATLRVSAEISYLGCRMTLIIEPMTNPKPLRSVRVTPSRLQPEKGLQRAYDIEGEKNLTFCSESDLLAHILGELNIKRRTRGAHV